MDEESDSGSITHEPIAEELRGGDCEFHLEEGSEKHVDLKHLLFQAIGTLAERCSVVAIRRMVHRSSAMGRAQLESFKLYAKAVAEKNGGNPNLKLGWYGASVEGVRRIVKNGFGCGGLTMGPLGFGLCIYGGFSAANCILSSSADAKGLRHIILCQVILGKAELVLPDSKQYGRSSDEFDSGVDDLHFPQKYIVWYSDAKTHVLPLYVIVVKLDTQSKGKPKEHVERPCTPWISFKLLISALSNCLSSSKLCLIKKLHIKYMERKISRLQLVKHLRKIVGDELLVSEIRKFQDKYRCWSLKQRRRSDVNQVHPKACLAGLPKRTPQMEVFSVYWNLLPANGENSVCATNLTYCKQNWRKDNILLVNLTYDISS